MALPAGARLGHFQIVGAIGAGGMGEVYRARDTYLGRDVALKVLPESLSNDPDRLRRFEDEARAAASLNHPNILALHEIGRDGAITYIVTELLDGRTLQETLASESLGLSRVIDLAAQIADGMAAAHARNLVHRDIKPGNIFVTTEGRAKLLDFGLAKTVVSDAAAVEAVTRSATAPHTVLGTAGYMAPEQVRGKPADHRADIFAFGAVLYEMAARRRAFAGDTSLETMSAILKEAPAPMASTADRPLPPALVRIVERCLEKAPAARFQSTTDLAFALKSLLLSDTDRTAAIVAATPASSRTWSLALPWALVAALAIAVAALWWMTHRQTASAPVLSFTIGAPPGTLFAGMPVAPFPAISPDGRHLAFVALSGDREPQVWVRPLASLDSRPLAGAGVTLSGAPTAPMPFWSPDGQSLAFFAHGKLKRIDLESNAVQTICDVPVNDGGAWAVDDTILFSGTEGALYRVFARGGAPVALASSDVRLGRDTRLPSFLPDGRRFLFHSASDSTTWMASLDGGAPRQVLDAADSAAVYAAPGYLLFVREQTLLAQRFDADRGAVEGEPMAIAEDVRLSPANRRAAFTVSRTGVLVYRSGNVDPVVPLRWFDRKGNALATVPDSFGRHSMPQLFPDDSRTMVHLHDDAQGGGDLWTIDSESGARTRITFDPGHDHSPVLSHDGQGVAWGSDRLGPTAVFRKPSIGTGAEELWIRHPKPIVPRDWSRNWFVFEVQNESDSDLWYAPVNDPGRARPYLDTRFRETEGRLSPDEKWMAYRSNEAGTDQIFVASFPDPTRGKRQVSGTVRAEAPMWSGNGRELYFVSGDVARTYVTTTSIEPTPNGVDPRPPQALFDILLPRNRNGAVTRDGERFLFPAIPQTPGVAETPLTVVTNWLRLVERR